MIKFICKKCGEEIHIGKVRSTYNKETQKMEFLDRTVCPKCGEEMSPETYGGINTPNVLNFKQLPDSHKKAILKKRAQKHFEKIGHEEKEWRKRETIKNSML